MRRSRTLICAGLTPCLVAAACCWVTGALAASPLDYSKLERSYWLHASLASSFRGYWGTNFPPAVRPTDAEIRNAARLLTRDYGANRLYLIYHKEFPVAEGESVFKAWRKFCPKEVELVPTLVLRAYDKGKSLFFSVEEFRELARFFKREINLKRVATYDVEIRPDQGPGFAVLAEEFPGNLIRVGIQPGEAIGPEFAWVVQDTWSGLCLGKSNDDWKQPGFGAEILRQWVEQRNGGRHPVSWDLVTVAWDYTPTERGTYPGYDDSKKNMPLPAGRNVLAARLIMSTAKREVLAGFSSDLFILQANSRTAPHDGEKGAFYATLKQGKVYRGYYAEPFREIVAIYQGLKKGKLPDKEAVVAR